MWISRWFWRFVARRVSRAMREQDLFRELERRERAERREAAIVSKIAGWPTSTGRALLEAGYTARGVAVILRDSLKRPEC